MNFHLTCMEILSNHYLGQMKIFSLFFLIYILLLNPSLTFTLKSKHHMFY